MTDYIIGSDWKNFKFHLANETHVFQITQHLNEYFLQDEPIHAYLLAKEKRDTYYYERFEALVKYLIDLGLSFYVTTKDDLNEIVGVTLLSDSRLPPWSKIPPTTSTVAKNIEILFKNLEELTLPKFKANYPCDFHAELFIVSTHRNYRGQGLAIEMIKRSCNFLKAKGFSIVSSEFSNPATRVIGAKLGFVDLDRVYFREQLDENGEKMFSNPNEEGFVTSTVKVL